MNLPERPRLERPRGRPNCPRCHGEGYVVEPRGAFAHAEICDCVPTCPLCGGTGYRYVERDGQRRLARCRCQMLPDRVALFNRAQIPARHARSSFATYRRDVPGAEVNYRLARQWLEGYRPGEENRGLVLSGEPGRGKTHLLVAILRELVMEHGQRVRFVEFSQLLSELKAGFDAGVGEATVLAPLVEVPVLAIDELGKGRGSEWEYAIVDALVSGRYNALATTLATTNYPFGASTGRGPLNLSSFVEAGARRRAPGPTLGDRVGDRVYSRLKEMCVFAPVVGEDYRLRLT